jgi:translation initiation factor IF-2
VTEAQTKATNTSHQIPKKQLTVAGIRVTHGDLERKLKFRILRNGKVIYDDLKVHSMRKLQEDVTKADKGQECGISFEPKDKNHPLHIQEGDLVESYREIELKEERKFNKNPGIRDED